MINIPLVFWLALVSIGNYNAGAVTIHPIPYASLEDCEIAARAFEDRPVRAVCYSQRRDDVLVFQKNAQGDLTRGYDR